MQVVWFKRDLRVADHAPLAKAAKSGQCLCLYVYEPELIRSDEFDTSHLQFINESLRQLDLQLRKIGGKLTLRVGRMPDVLDEFHRKHGIDALWSHEETGNKLTYDRDRRVGHWAAQNGIPWCEIPQNGVVRRLRSRDGWSARTCRRPRLRSRLRDSADRRQTKSCHGPRSGSATCPAGCGPRPTTCRSPPVVG